MLHSRASVETRPFTLNVVKARMPGSPGRGVTLARRLILVLAIALQLVTGSFYLAAGLVAPAWAVLLLWASWIGLLWVLVQLWNRHATLALLVPPASLGLFLAALSAGETWLGWVA